MSFQLIEYVAPDFSLPALANAPDATTLPAPMDGVAPEGYHGTTIFPEYFKVGGRWLLCGESRMDCVTVLRGDRVDAVEFRNLRAGDKVFVGRAEDGSQGIYVHTSGFPEDAGANGDVFAFRQGRSRETAFSIDYDHLYELLRHERDHGNILWVMGPACAFDHDARQAFANLIAEGYVHGLLAGNALATHDLEGAYLGTALGQDIYTQVSQPGGHYNHMDVINEVRRSGSIAQFIADNSLDDGIMCALERHGVPYVLAGSIRDDGPLPEVVADAYDAQLAMHGLIKEATTIVCMATMLHSIATGNMAPSYHVNEDGSVRPVMFYAVDATEFAVNKLRDRGSLSVTTIVANAHDFVTRLARGLGLSW